jgi:hypothetical protein
LVCYINKGCVERAQAIDKKEKKKRVQCKCTRAKKRNSFSSETQKGEKEKLRFSLGRKIGVFFKDKN